MAFQHTISHSVEIEGIGLHTGRPCRLRLNPAAAGDGLTFLLDGRTVPARAEFVISTQRAMVLGKNGRQVSTVEHLLASLNAMGIDNVSAEVEGPEIPIIDGSAVIFVEKIREAGKKRLMKEAPVLHLRTPLWVSGEDDLLLALPSPALRLTYMGDFPGLGFQQRSLSISPKIFAEQIAPARTFVSQEQIQSVLTQGLGQGGSLENVVVLGGERPSTPLRFADEPLRHKLLDLLGDMALLGKGLQAHIIAIRSGHRLNLELVKKLREAETR
ncbi:MAG: UDP-3-O-[3-hydroxymyristoyl] N-acetylglucosamine deacetylase [Armatimonadetes bacterium]|nr:UDP-3-O-[3-hydroxymyristoyl] N-acetylglucosamine deacetylase [Armatimonadota bacterium]NIM23673.1 UDP-3-O-[3-hydroxymyristoyl] N-acetylglucosamine deacetylase [Armatimonadota bacterium]NIM67544.1 UDP-3-O-[3-hydroxymyristoyl] N-acetylglucosamine deacetylase [Armatimonadota bacterium]NIM76061.1 UDP-3-O-[3-hydroxymyristoyl] N-acetylglucosamine deacetylase [Armatimonadota bacterium]NIN05731.1 UDP-3-O-[3-hydroxymyristoyl] N-acetylglucosamine deacetylase [Armatimonadota bacterium]